MAIVVTSLSGGGNKSSETQHQVGVAADVAIGDLVIVQVVADNAGTAGASSITTPTDTQGNTYALVKAENRTGGSALDGLTVALYQSVITAALTVAGSDKINYNFSPATVAKTYLAIKVTGANTTAYATDNASGSGASYSSNASVSMASGDLYVGLVGNESATQPGADSDTTNGSWVDTTGAGGITSGGSGGDATKMSSRQQHKITTGSGTQTLNGSTGASTDWAVVAALYTVPSTYTPTIVINASVNAAQNAGSW